MESDSSAAAATAASAPAEMSPLEAALSQLPEDARKQIEQRMIAIETSKQEQQKIANEATAQLANGSKGDKVYLEQQLALLLDHLGAVGPQFNVAGVANHLEGPGAASAVSRLVAACNTKFMGLDTAEAPRAAKRTKTEHTVESPAPAAAAVAPDVRGGSSNALLRQALAAQYS